MGPQQFTTRKIYQGTKSGRRTALKAKDPERFILRYPQKEKSKQNL